MVHILCDTKFSPDGDSSTTGSVVTIRQRSIQTIYNTEDENPRKRPGAENPSMKNEGLLWFYNRNETHTVESVYPYVDTDYGNDSRPTGLQYGPALGADGRNGQLQECAVGRLPRLRSGE